MNITRNQILKYAIPSVISMLVSSLYVVVDGIFIGNGVDANALASVNIALPFAMVSAAVAAMVMMGGSTICAIRLGRRDKQGAQDAFLTSLVLSLIFGILFTVAGAGFPQIIARLSGATEVLMDGAVEYIRYFSLFQVFSLLALMGSSFVRIDGRPNLAFVGMVVLALHYSWFVSNLISSIYSLCRLLFVHISPVSCTLAQKQDDICTATSNVISSLCHP